MKNIYASIKGIYLASVALIILAAILTTKPPPPGQDVQNVASLGKPTFSFKDGAIRPMKITCLTIGSRGDVQPYIALALGLQEDGHTVTIATHLEFQDMIENAGIRFKNIGGDPKELTKHCVEYGIFSPGFYTKGAKTVKRMGAEAHIKTFRVSELTNAFKRATTNSFQIQKAKEIGEVIREENGVKTAIQKIYLDLKYAQDLINKGFEEDEMPREPPPPLLKTNAMMDWIGNMVRKRRATIHYSLMAIVRWFQISSIMQQNQESSSDDGLLGPEKQNNASLSATFHRVW